MSDTKKYRLLKDTPSEKAGDIYEQRADIYINITEYSNNSPVIESNSYFSWQVENNPEWFELVEDKTMVTSFNGPMRMEGGFSYGITVSKMIDAKKYKAIWKAIEFVLNSGYDDLIVTPQYIVNKIFNQKTFTEQELLEELLEAERRGFDAARKGLKNGYADERSFHGVYYKTFSDYKNKKTNEHIKSNLQ